VSRDDQSTRWFMSAAWRRLLLAAAFAAAILGLLAPPASAARAPSTELAPFAFSIDAADTKALRPQALTELKAAIRILDGGRPSPPPCAIVSAVITLPPARDAGTAPRAPQAAPVPRPHRVAAQPRAPPASRT
jgi:hypothetical protein